MSNETFLLVWGICIAACAVIGAIAGSVKVADDMRAHGWSGIGVVLGFLMGLCCGAIIGILLPIALGLGVVMLFVYLIVIMFEYLWS